jgi:hypothetical protein
VIGKCKGENIMSIFSKVCNKASYTPVRLQNRFTQGGFVTMGARTNPIRTNSAKEIQESIKFMLQREQNLANTSADKALHSLKAQEIQDFANNMADMPQRHLSLAHDIIDLSNTEYLLPNGIFAEDNFNAIGTVNSTGKKTTLMGYVLNLLPKLSKENPNALDLAEKVCTHSDDVNSKFFLSRFLDKVTPDRAEQMKATEPMVENLSKSVLNGSPTLDFNSNCKENVFLQLINSLTAKDSKPENLKLFNKALKITDGCDASINCGYNVSELRLGDTAKIKENMEQLPELLDNASKQGVKDLDISGFLTKNVDMK